MKKRILGLLLCFVMLAALLPVSAMATGKNELTYVITSYATVGRSVLLQVRPGDTDDPVTFRVKDDGGTGATITDHDVFLATKPGVATITAIVTDDKGKDAPYEEDFEIIVQDVAAIVAAGGAIWDYETGALLSGAAPAGISYNAASHTLTLDNAKITTPYVQEVLTHVDDEEHGYEMEKCFYGIYADKDLNIVLRGSSSISFKTMDDNASETALGDVAVTGGRVTVSGDGSLTTTVPIRNDEGLLEINGAEINCPGMGAHKIRVNNGRVVANGSGLGVTFLVVDGDEAYVEGRSSEEYWGYGIQFGCAVCGNGKVEVKGGTVIAYGTEDCYAYGFIYSDDTGEDNNAPKIHPSYTEARVWMGMTEEEALAKGPQEQSVLVDNNGMRYIKIAPLPKTPDEPDQPVPPDLPVTGDSTHLGLLLFLCVASGAACILFLKRKKTYAAK